MCLLAVVRMEDIGGETTRFSGNGRCGTEDEMAKISYRLSKGAFAERIKFGGQKSK